MDKIQHLAKQVGEQLLQAQATLVTAESCTGGGLSYAITSVSGSSKWFDRGYVTYTVQSKIALLEIPSTLLESQGAVSQAVVEAMAKNALRLSHTSWSIAITGIAGPEGGTPDCPVGTVWIAWANASNELKSQCFHFNGERQSIREQAIETALSGLLAL